jgi:hypothetical protein
MAEPQWYTKQGPDGKWYKTQASSPQEATQKLLRSIGGGTSSAPAAHETFYDKAFPRTATFSAGRPQIPGLGNMESEIRDLRNRLQNSVVKDEGGKAGNTLASAPLGLMKLAEALPQLLRGEIWKGTKNAVSGAVQAAEIPSAFIAPEASEAVKSILPSTERAGQLFQELEKVAGNVPVDVQKPGQIATKIWDLAEAGGTLPKVINKFLRRVTNPQGTPMDYSEMRQFYQNATRLSADEMNRLTPAVKRFIGDFTQKMGDSLWEAANSVGEGGKFNKAMKGYRQGARFNELKDKAAKAALVAGLGAAGAGAYRHWVPK